MAKMEKIRASHVGGFGMDSDGRGEITKKGDKASKSEERRLKTEQLGRAKREEQLKKDRKRLAKRRHHRKKHENQNGIGC